jgi:hypothetical protein
MMFLRRGASVGPGPVVGAGAGLRVLVEVGLGVAALVGVGVGVKPAVGVGDLGIRGGGGGRSRHAVVARLSVTIAPARNRHAPAGLLTTLRSSPGNRGCPPCSSGKSATFSNSIQQGAG